MLFIPYFNSTAILKPEFHFKTFRTTNLALVLWRKATSTSWLVLVVTQIDLVQTRLAYICQNLSYKPSCTLFFVYVFGLRVCTQNVVPREMPNPVDYFKSKLKALNIASCCALQNSQISVVSD